MALSEEEEEEKDRQFAASMVGTWDVDGDLIIVSENDKGGLDAVTSDGRKVGAGMVFAGRKVPAELLSHLYQEHLRHLYDEHKRHTSG